MIWHVQNENFILDSTRLFMKAFHFLLFDGSLIFPECIPIFGLILLLMIDSTSDQKDIPRFYFISSTSLVMSIAALLFRWGEEPMISFSGNFQTNNFNEILSISYFTRFKSMYSSIRIVHWMYRNGYNRISVIRINSYSRGNVFMQC